jgi:hypothetical protein
MIYLGKYIFFKRASEATIDLKADWVLDEKKLNSKKPQSM